MQIKVFGIGCEKHRQLVLNLKEALSEIGIQAEIEEVKSTEAIAEAGFSATPGLVIDGEPLCSGYVPSVDELTVLFSKYLRVAV